MSLNLDYIRKAFPHCCRVYRIVNEDEFSDGEEQVIYCGLCRDEGNSAMRTYQQGGVMKSDHAIYIPVFLKGVSNDCYIDIVNDCVELERLQISSCQPVQYGNRVGTTIMYNEPKN